MWIIEYDGISGLEWLEYGNNINALNQIGIKVSKLQNDNTVDSEYNDFFTKKNAKDTTLYNVNKKKT